MTQGHPADCACAVCARERHTHDGHNCNCSGREHTEEEGCGCGHEHTQSFQKYPVRLFVGVAVFIAAIIITNVWTLPQWGELLLFAAAYVILGGNVLAAAGKNIIKGKVFDENFLMTVATAGAFVLGEYIEGTAVMLFYLVGETLSDLAVDKSRKSITSLMDIRPDYANIETEGGFKTVHPSEVRVGDVIVIKPYEKVPLDSVVVEGETTLNTSALTGESLPREAYEGCELLSGFVNGAGLVKARVQKVYGESTAAKILDMVENAGSRKAQTEKFITKFAKVYTPIVCAAALVVAVVPSLVTGEWSVWVYRALLFLVISCPCALVVAVPLSYFGGIGGASRRGILVKGASYLEALTGINEVVMDKTGTLTMGSFSVVEIVPARGYSKEELLAAAAAAEVHSSHPIAKSVLAAYGNKAADVSAGTYEDIAGHGVKAEYNGETVLAGNARLMRREGILFDEAEIAGTALYVAKDHRYMGYIVIADTLKEDAVQTVDRLRAMGIGTAMLTGDTDRIAQTVAAQAGIREVYSELLPQDKVGVVEQIEKQGTKVAFVGDGINDAPVLARADVGIAMGGLGSDAAIEAADVVLMNDDLQMVPTAIGIAKKTKRIVWQNIIFALAVKAVVMVLGVTGIADMWAAVFADVGVTLIAVLNALRALKVPRD